MEEIWNKLLNEEVLSEDTIAELKAAVEQQTSDAISEAVESAVAEEKAKVQVELREQFIQEREALLEATEKQLELALKEELDELKHDIERFRDLETEFAQKLVEEKAQLATQFKSDMAELVENLNTFLEVRLHAELEELKDDLQEQKNNHFGRKLFDAFREEWEREYFDADESGMKVSELEQRVADLAAALEEAETRNAAMVREDKLDAVLQPLSGTSREIMEAILNNIPTEQLDEAYTTFLPRVLRQAETKHKNSGDNLGEGNKVLAEGASNKDSNSVEVVTGDNIVKEEELSKIDDGKQQLNEDYLKGLRKLAGIE